VDATVEVVEVVIVVSVEKVEVLVTGLESKGGDRSGAWMG